MVLYVGLSGTMAAGKGVTRSIIEGRYKTLSFSLSDILREEADERGIERTRKNLTDIGNELRKKHGPGVLAKKIIEKIARQRDGYERIIIDSIRNPGEVSELRRALKKDFLLLFIDAPLGIRYKRTKLRQREGESADSFETFSMMNESEFEGSDEKGIRLKECKIEADYVIENDRTIGELRKKVYEITNERISSMD